MDQLKRLRTEKGLSQAKLAALADIDPSTVNQIERGAREASPATLRKLAQALDVSIAELLEDTAPKVGSRSSLEQSFNDVLAEERRKEERRDVYDLVLEAARRQREQDRQAAARAEESERPQTYFAHHENDAISQLAKYPPDQLASILLDVMHRYLLLEEAYERERAASEENAETFRRHPE